MIDYIKSFARPIWRDFTPVGRWTIAVPFIILTFIVFHILLCCVVPLPLFLLYLLDEKLTLKIVERTEKAIEWAFGLFFKKSLLTNDEQSIESEHSSSPPTFP